MLPGVSPVRVGRVPAGVAAVCRDADGIRFHQGFLEVTFIVQRYDGAGGTVVVDPLHVPHTEAYTAGRSTAAEFVVLPCLQCGLVLAVIRHGVEEVRAGNARGILPVDAAVERPPDILVGGLERACFRGRCILPARRHKRLHRLRELAGSIEAIHNDEVLRCVDSNTVVMTALVGAGVCASIDEGVGNTGRYIANGTAVCDGPVGAKRADSPVHGEVYLAGADVPVSVGVGGNAGELKVHMAILAVEPAVVILINTGGAKVHLAANNTPPAELILCYAGVVEVYTSVDHAPPAVLILGYAGVPEVHIAVRHLPPAMFILRNTGVRSVDGAIPNGGPSPTDFLYGDAFGGAAHAAVKRRRSAHRQHDVLGMRTKTWT